MKTTTEQRKARKALAIALHRMNDAAGWCRYDVRGRGSYVMDHSEDAAKRMLRVSEFVALANR